ncbi:MAG: single-stranded DNA-binding protein [PVC group bacterium]|nr:single-stranded DNA-binding protein [PVC group bacterium]
MANLNKVLLMGNLTRDPELRYAPNGSAVTTFSVAMSRVFNNAAGEKKEDVCYVRVVCWARLAQTCSEYLFKGRPVFVEGRLQSRSWQAQDGTKRNTIEVIAQNVQFLGKGKTQDSSSVPDASAMGVGMPESSDALGGVNFDGMAVQAKQDEEVPF